MTDKLVNLRDIRFVLYEVLKVEGLLDSERYSGHSRETFDMAIDAAYKLAREVFWPAYAEMDRIGATHDAKSKKTRVPESMHKIWRAYKEAAGTARPPRPSLAGNSSRACGRRHGVDVQCREHRRQHVYRRRRRRRRTDPFVRQRQAEETYLEKLYGGEWGGTMCLTEPQAGSSLSDVKTTAVKATDGDYYLLTGTKCFISSGDQDITENIVHPVLARLPAHRPG